MNKWWLYLKYLKQNMYLSKREDGAIQYAVSF